jgi:hypothetical protein
MHGRSNSQAKTSSHVRQSGGAQGPGCDGNKTKCKSRKNVVPHQQHGDREHIEVLMLISYNCVKQAIQKEFIDLCAHMVPSKQHWEKLVKKSQKNIKRKFPSNKTMCKKSGVFPTLITIKLQIIIRNQSSYMFLGYVQQRRRNSIYLNNSTKNNYKLIEDFQGQKIINVPTHIQDMNDKGDVVYIPLA